MKFPLHCYWNQLWSLSAPQHTKWTPPTTTSCSGGSGGGVVVVVVFVCSCNTASSVCLLSLWKHEALGECRVVFFPSGPLSTPVSSYFVISLPDSVGFYYCEISPDSRVYFRLSSCLCWGFKVDQCLHLIDPRNRWENLGSSIIYYYIIVFLIL